MTEPWETRPLILGLTGTNGSGKGVAAEHLRSLGFAVHSLSDAVRQECARMGIETSRENLIRIGNRIRMEEGPGALARRLLPALGSRDVVDSIRNPAEVDALRSLAGFRLLGVRAPQQERFRRASLRARPGDPATLEEFKMRERQENTGDPTAQRLDATLALADRVIDNDGSIEAFCRAIDDLLGLWESAAV